MTAPEKGTPEYVEGFLVHMLGLEFESPTWESIEGLELWVQHRLVPRVKRMRAFDDPEGAMKTLVNQRLAGVALSMIHAKTALANKAPDARTAMRIARDAALRLDGALELLEASAFLRTRKSIHRREEMGDTTDAKIIAAARPFRPSRSTPRRDKSKTREAAIPEVARICNLSEHHVRDRFKVLFKGELWYLD